MENIKNKTVTVYVNLPEEGSPTLRRAQALSIEGDIFQLLPDDNYDPEDEVWEFLPYSYVKCEWRDDGIEKYLQAIKEISDYVKLPK